MPSTEQHGIAYVFGFATSDAPVITNFAARRADLRYEPEVFQEATNGEGQRESVALSNVSNRMVSGTFTGYIVAGFSGNSIANNFNFTVNGVSRRFIVKSISDPRNKGEYAEVSLDVVSYPLIGPTAAITT